MAKSIYPKMQAIPSIINVLSRWVKLNIRWLCLKALHSIKSILSLFTPTYLMTDDYFVNITSYTKLRSDIVAGLLGSSHSSWIEADFLERNLVLVASHSVPI